MNFGETEGERFGEYFDWLEAMEDAARRGDWEHAHSCGSRAACRAPRALRAGLYAKVAQYAKNADAAERAA